MKISTKGRYGIRAALELAGQYGGAPVAMAEISRKQDIPEKYLEQLLQMLRRAGIVQAVRGVQGGYLLSRPPREIAVGEVLRAMEGDISPAACVLEGGCDREGGCAMRLLYQRIEQSVSDVVDNTTLQELVDEQISLDEAGKEAAVV